MIDAGEGKVGHRIAVEGLIVGDDLETIFGHQRRSWPEQEAKFISKSAFEAILKKPNCTIVVPNDAAGVTRRSGKSRRPEIGDRGFVLRIKEIPAAAIES